MTLLEPPPVTNGTLHVPELDDDVDILTAALAYAAAGWYVGPLALTGDRKHPGSILGNGWPAKTSRDTKTIAGWFAGTRHGTVGLFLHCGRSGAWVADVDHAEHLPPALVDAIDRVAPPFQSSRPNDPGRGHHVFRQPAGRTLGNGRGRLGSDWGEARGTNGIIVAHPTPRGDGGRYRWLRTGPVPALPDTVADLLPDAGPGADAVDDAALSGFLTAHTAANARGLLRPITAKFNASVAAGGSRHGAALEATCWAMREAAAGHFPALEAAGQLRDLFVDAMANPRTADDRALDRHLALDEFHGITAWAIGQVDPADLPARRAATDARLNGHQATAPAADPEDGSGPTLPVPASIDDANMAAAFAQAIAGHYLYCAQLGGWFHWDGRRWQRDHDKAIYETCRQWVLALGAQLFRSDADGDQVRKVTSYRSKARIEAVAEMAGRIDGIVAAPASFDRDPDLLCVRNGVLNLRTGQLKAHDPALRITKYTDTDYRPDATHPDVDAVLEVADPDVRHWLQAFFGYAATGHVTDDLMPVFDGTGSNGKTTLLGAVASALGDYASAASPRLLMKGSHDAHPTIFADLHGRRLVYIEETAEGGSLAVETMKALTGGGRVKAHFMRKDQFEFDTTHKLIVATNHRPAINSTEHATWRRLRLVPFPHRYARPQDARPQDRPIDKGLRARLRTGRPQREATLAWVVAGAVSWARHGLPDCPALDDATDSWRASEDVIYRFITERCELGPAFRVGSSELHSTYRFWCETEGRPACSNKELAKRIEDHDLAAAHSLARSRNAAGIVWTGLQIRSNRDAF